MTENKSGPGGGLYVAWHLAWQFPDTAAGSAQEVKDRLTQGEELNLYTLHSWVVAEGEAQALLSPAASLEEITAAIWERSPELPCGTFTTRCISSSQDFTELTREIETVPVQLGLARRPEEWPFSSASHE